MAIDLADPQHEWPKSALPHLAIPLKQSTTLTSRVLFGTTGISGNIPRIKLTSSDGKKVALELTDGLELFVGPPRSSKMRLVSQKVIELPLGAWLHTGPVDKPHRVFEILKP